jgi:hypothetical protein
MKPARRSLFNRLPMIWLSVAAFIGLFASSSQATLIATESFNYTQGSSVISQGTNTGWPTSGQTWSGSSLGKIDTDSKMSYNNLLTSGNHLETAIVNGQADGVYRSFGPTPYGTAGKTYWFSTLIRVDVATGTSYGGVSLFTGTNPSTATEHFFYGQRNVSSLWGFEQHGGTGADSSISSTNQVVGFLVVELIGGTGGGSGTAKLYVNPTSLGGSAPSTASATFSFTDFSFDAYRVQSGSKTGSLSEKVDVDELRFGTTYGDVTPAIPEPTTYLLLSIGICAVAVCRRLKKIS